MTPTMPTIGNLLKVSNNKNITLLNGAPVFFARELFLSFIKPEHILTIRIHFQTDYHRKSIPEEFLHCPKKCLTFL